MNYTEQLELIDELLYHSECEEETVDLLEERHKLMDNIKALENAIADARYHAKHFASYNMRASDQRYIAAMESQLDTLKRQAGVGCQLPLWLPINPYNKVPVYNDIGQQTGWIF